MRRFLAVCTGLALVTLGACATDPVSPSDTCPRGTGSPALMFEVFFGRSVPGRGEVTQAEWRRFEEEVIVAHLPGGYTILDASGAWRSQTTGKTIHENSKVLTVAMPDQAESVDAVTHIRAAYQARFQQQSVGMAAWPGCASF